MSKDNHKQELVKAAARRMCEYLAGKGVSVKHMQMLEALATGLGVANWRMLRAALDAPREDLTAIKPLAPEPGTEQRWLVDAIYDDNDQQWSDYVQARTALEAAAMAKMERRTDCGLIIDVTNVTNAAGETLLSPGFYKQEYQFGSSGGALRSVLKAAQKLRRQASKRQVACMDWLRDCLKILSKDDDLMELTDCEANEQAHEDGARFEFIQDGEAFTASQALCALCDLIEEAAGGVVAMEQTNDEAAFLVHQVRALTVYFGSVLDNPEYGGLTPDATAF